MIAAGGLSGGLGSVIGGGDFWSGVRNGLIVSALNHGLHNNGSPKGIDSNGQSQGEFIGPLTLEQHYYEALIGLIFDDGTVVTRENLLISFRKDLDGDPNARWLGFDGERHYVNFHIEDYEHTSANIRNTLVHEMYGHGIKSIPGGARHYQAYEVQFKHSSFANTTNRLKSTLISSYRRYYTQTARLKWNTAPQEYRDLWNNYFTEY